MIEKTKEKKKKVTFDLEKNIYKEIPYIKSRKNNINVDTVMEEFNQLFREFLANNLERIEKTTAINPDEIINIKTINKSNIKKEEKEDNGKQKGEEKDKAAKVEKNIS